jgi:hypothetical protein
VATHQRPFRPLSTPFKLLSTNLFFDQIAGNTRKAGHVGHVRNEELYHVRKESRVATGYTMMKNLYRDGTSTRVSNPMYKAGTVVKGRLKSPFP